MKSLNCPSFNQPVSIANHLSHLDQQTVHTEASVLIILA